MQIIVLELEYAAPIISTPPSSQGFPTETFRVWGPPNNLVEVKICVVNFIPNANGVILGSYLPRMPPPTTL